ncbi:MAG: hypothetical protein M3Y70_09525 [Pseudomonadota bacterium]|nr:hypothetical protein [Pseudomonadota bacterium]
MFRPTHRPLVRNALSALVALDLLGLATLVSNQWFAIDPVLAWGVAAVLALPVYVLVMPLSNAVVAMADRFGGVPDAGEKIPGAGQ